MERCEAVKGFLVGVCIVGKLDIGKVGKVGLAGEVIEIDELTVGIVVCGRTRGTLIGVAVDSYIINVIILT